MTTDLFLPMNFLPAIFWSSVTVTFVGFVFWRFLHWRQMLILHSLLLVRLLLPIPAPRIFLIFPESVLWRYVAAVYFIGVAASFFCAILRTLANCRAALTNEVALNETCSVEFLAARKTIEVAGRPIFLLITRGKISAMAAGFLRPLVVIPEALAELDAAKLRHILYHELIHIRKGDLFMNAFWSLAQALHWFNPFIGRLAANCRKCQEMRCDESVCRVLPEENAPLAYAQTLLDMAEYPNLDGGVCCLNESGNTMKARVESLLAPIPVTRFNRLAAGMIAFFLVLSFYPLSASRKAEDAWISRKSFTQTGDALKFYSQSAGRNAGSVVLMKDNDVFTITGTNTNAMVKLWAKNVPDPVIQEIDRLAESGLAFARVMQISENPRMAIGKKLGVDIKVLYNTFPMYGNAQLNIFEVDSNQACTVPEKFMNLGVRVENIFFLGNGKLAAELIPRQMSKEQADTVRKILNPHLRRQDMDELIRLETELTTVREILAIYEARFKAGAETLSEVNKKKIHMLDTRRRMLVLQQANTEILRPLDDELRELARENLDMFRAGYQAGGITIGEVKEAESLYKRFLK